MLLLYSPWHCVCWPGDAWWRHKMETFSALLALCAGNSLVTGEFPTQRSVTRSFDVFFDLRLNKWLNKRSWVWWFETLSCSLWRHCNGKGLSTRFSQSFHIQFTRLHLLYILLLYSSLWNCLVVEYFVLWIFLYRTSTMAYLCWSYFTWIHSDSFYSITLLDWRACCCMDHSGPWLALIASRS